LQDGLVGRLLGGVGLLGFGDTATGRVATVSNPTGTSSYLYDAAGAILIRTDPLTGTTLYLGGTEVRLPVGASTLAATRHYSFAGMTIAQRDTSTGLKALHNDPQGTRSTTARARSRPRLPQTIAGAGAGGSTLIRSDRNEQIHRGGLYWK
jgi:YD repeat-containing protein